MASKKITKASATATIQKAAPAQEDVRASGTNPQTPEPYKNKLGIMRFIRLTELADILQYDYRHLLTKLRNIERKNGVVIVTKEDSSLKKTPYHVDTEMLFFLVPQLSPLQDNTKLYILRIQELEAKVSSLEDVLVVNGLMKNRTETF